MFDAPEIIFKNGEDIELTEKSSEVRDFEDVLRLIGGFGRYQKIQLFIFIPLTFVLAYVCYSPILFLYTPDHWCSIDPFLTKNNFSYEELFQALIPLESNGKPSKCHIYNFPLESQFNPRDRDKMEKVPCKYGWTYNLTGYFSTATTQMDWVCEDSWKPAFSQGVFYFGGIIGTLFFGYTADTFGRKWTFLASNLLLAITGLITPFCNTFVTFIIIRFLMGLSNLTFFSVFFLLTLEYVSVEKRAVVGNLSLALGITLGGIYQPWLIKIVGDWKIYHHMLYIQTWLFLITPWFIHESLRWLASKNRINECLDIMRDISEQNGKCLTIDMISNFEKMVREQQRVAEKLPGPNITSLFQTPKLRKNMILMIITWMMIASMFDGHIRNISNLDYSIYATFTMSAALELPADLLAIWGLNFFGRRFSAFFSLTLSTISMFACAAFQGNTAVVTTFAMFGRFFITYAMNTGAQISFEIAPTVLRGQGNALANVFAQASQFFSPFIVYSSVHSPILPFILLGCGSMVGAITALFLPETADEHLPDTIEEAEKFGENQKFFHMPCLNKTEKNSKLMKQ